MDFKGDFFSFNDKIYSVITDIPEFISSAKALLLSTCDESLKTIINEKIKLIYSNYNDRFNSELKSVMIEYFPILQKTITPEYFKDDGIIYELDNIQDEFNDNNGQFNFVHIKSLEKCIFNPITQDLFNDRVKNKFSFFNELNLKNVIISGGFCRSILLDQEVNDFDFFFVGEDHVSDLIRTLKSVVFIIKKYYPRSKFLYCFKKTFNVLEIITFDQYNIDMIQFKFQFIMTKFDSIYSVLDHFDMNPCKVAWDGEKTYFTKSGYNSYRYMTNYIDLSKETTPRPYRIAKYSNYGFNLGMSQIDFEKLFNEKCYKGRRFKFGSNMMMSANKYEDYDELQLRVYYYCDKVPEKIKEKAKEIENSKENQVYKDIHDHHENKIAMYGGTYCRTYLSNNTMSVEKTIKFYEDHGGVFGVSNFLPEMHIDGEIIYCKFSDDINDIGDITIVSFNDKIPDNTQLYYGYESLETQKSLYKDNENPTQKVVKCEKTIKKTYDSKTLKI